MELFNYVMSYPGLILGLHPANERLRYFVTMSLIGWLQADNQHWHPIVSYRSISYPMESKYILSSPVSSPDILS